MRFSIIASSLLVSLALAAPIQQRETSAEKAAASAAAAACPAVATSASATTATTADDAAATTAAAAASTGGALVASAYNDFQISSGTAGTAEDEANALFTSVDQNDLANVSAADLKVIQGIHDAAEDAETSAFDPAIDAASGDAATALQNGKIKNKVLKLTAEVLGLQIETAQGDDKSADITEEQTKLANNIKLDTAAAGQASTAVSFDESS